MSQFLTSNVTALVCSPHLKHHRPLRGQKTREDCSARGSVIHSTAQRTRMLPPSQQRTAAVRQTSSEPLPAFSVTVSAAIQNLQGDSPSPHIRILPLVPASTFRGNRLTRGAFSLRCENSAASHLRFHL